MQQQLSSTSFKETYPNSEFEQLYGKDMRLLSNPENIFFIFKCKYCKKEIKIQTHLKEEVIKEILLYHLKNCLSLESKKTQSVNDYNKLKLELELIKEDLRLEKIERKQNKDECKDRFEDLENRISEIVNLYLGDE